LRVLINIDVPNLAAAVDFYRAALDLELERVIDGDVAELSGADASLYLLERTPHSTATRGDTGFRAYTRHWTPVHVDFVVDDLEAAAERAVAAGARRESETAAWRGSRCITFADPFGNGFCLIELAGGRYADD
jgi:predicted enzyme related to lactoylglutathione lyase